VNKLQHVLELMMQSHLKVTIGGTEYQDKMDGGKLLRECKIEDADPDITQLADPTFVQFMNKKLPLKELLSRGLGTESKAQQTISQPRYLAKLRATDPSSETNRMFSLPRRVGESENIYPATAKFDLLSEVCSMAMEFKATPAESSRSGEPINAVLAGITQGLERLLVLRSTNATLRAFVLFAVTGQSAWKLMFQRCVASFNLPDAKEPFEQVIVKRISHNTIWEHWCGYMKLSIEEPEWYLTEDAQHILSTLNAITAGHLCGTQLHQSSVHRVYAVSLPQIVEYVDPNGTRKATVGVNMLKHDFCLKIIADKSTFDREAAVASSVCVSYNQMFPGSQFHLLAIHELSDAEVRVGQQGINDTIQVESRHHHTAAHKDYGSTDEDSMETNGTASAMNEDWSDSDEEGGLSCQQINLAGKDDAELAAAPVEPEGSVVVAVAEATAFLESLSSIREPQILPRRAVRGNQCEWRQVPKQAGQTGGTLLMRVGTRATITRATFHDVLSGVFRTLRPVHSSSHVHCDIREPNILLFDNEYQLIDYDCGLKIAKGNHSVTFKYQAGGQYKSRPKELENYQIGERVAWTTNLDTLMAASCVANSLAKEK
jgi:hypothetical protein